MSDNAALTIVIAIACICLTTCSISDDWRNIEKEKIKCAAPTKANTPNGGDQR